MTSVQVQNLHYAYHGHKALNGVDFSIPSKTIFGLLGPNGSGKTTLFRIFSTLLLPAEGSVRMLGSDLVREYALIREKIGVVFQSPSLDLKLTVRENLYYQGLLYGWTGTKLRDRMNEMLARLGIADRRHDAVAKLSGGLKRRVELAKGLLHRPQLLILDEPSTGLDPGARLDFWNYLKILRDQEGITIIVTTHLMEEVEHCGSLIILSEGKVAASGTPEALKKEIGGDVILLRARETESLKRRIYEKFQVEALALDEILQLEHPHGAQFITQLVEAFPGQIESVTFRKPTLEDVFIHKTGHRFWSEG